MNKKIIIATVLILIVSAFSAFIAWCSGYNFDERKPAVALWIGMTIVFCFPILGILGVVV